ncbi:hypothetical protein C8R45DRAFT_1095638 [Mycena sanguinolenta]|nr:hypothetical protein C8R45DRAFT_1095638 [Mycena sanguinolenta]
MPLLQADTKTRALIDSDSDSDIPSIPSYRPTPRMKSATVKAVSRKPPVFHEGNCTQVALRQFEVAFANYCTLKAVTEDSAKMAIAVSCFFDHKTTDWREMEAEHPCILKMSFKEFMDTLLKCVLPKNWEHNMCLLMNQHRQQSDESFLDFQTVVRALNSHLTNTDFHLNNEHLCILLETNMLVELQEDCIADTKAKDEEDLLTWLEEVKHVDSTRTHQNACLRSIDKQCERERKRECEPKCNTTDDGRNNRPAKHNGNSNGGQSSGGLTGGSSNGISSGGSSNGSHRCPKLTTTEADLLNTHHGCRKCRKPYVTHAYDDRCAPNLYQKNQQNTQTTIQDFQK